MAQLGRLIRVATSAATDFRAAVAQNVMATLDLTVPGTLGQKVVGRVTGLVLKSAENLDWEVVLFRTAAFATLNADTSKFSGRVNFVIASGIRYPSAASGFFYYATAGLDILYQDEDATGKLHIGLIPRSAGKSAGDAGAIALEFLIDPTIGAN